MLYKGLLFKNRKFNFKKLQKFGFKVSNNKYIYKTTILDNLFELTIEINSNGNIYTNLIETETKEDYNLIYVKNATGEFIGKVKEEFENILNKIKNECTSFSAFQSEYANLIIKYIKEKYNDEPEYLWEKLSDTCVFRRKDKKDKWYAILLTVSKNKIGLPKDDIVEIIDLKAPPETIEKIVDNKTYFKGYHMNKKHWFTICLNSDENFVDIEEIKKRIDDSYNSL